jgi:hypothetical protein
LASPFFSGIWMPAGVMVAYCFAMWAAAPHSLGKK